MARNANTVTACAAALLGLAAEPAGAGPLYEHGPPAHQRDARQEIQISQEHEIGESASPGDEDAARDLMRRMRDIGLVLPAMDSARGRSLFLERGCIACHSVNGVGGDMAPPLDARQMPNPMNAFEFAARMWRGAPAMVQLQEDILGETILLDGQDLADIIAFAHDETEQKKLTADQIPPVFRDYLLR